MNNLIFRKISRILPAVLLFFILFFIILPTVILASTAAEPNIELQIPILGFTQAQNIAVYIKALYQAASYIVVPFVIIIIILGGIEWLTAAGRDPEGMNKAKTRIFHGLIGLGIVLFSYVLLSFVGITSLNTPSIEYIPEEEADDTEDPLWNGPNPTTSNFEQTLTENNDSSVDLIRKAFIAAAEAATPANYNINCPKELKNPTIQQLAQYFNGKVTYRMGGKGGPPQYKDDTYKCENNVPCKTFCPKGQLCLDCSGMANLILACSGHKYIDSGTKGQFGCSPNCSTSEKITKPATATALNGKELKPGDLVGYPKCSKGQFGHVYIYISNGKVLESHGSNGAENPESGRISGRGIRVTNLIEHDWVGKKACVRRWE
ncbi:MAG: NlpC/P60 family protein [Patescibacteria group bacterium]